jgi:hypothetical protein
MAALALLGFGAFEFAGQVTGHATTLTAQKRSAPPRQTAKLTPPPTPTALAAPTASATATAQPTAPPRAQTILPVSAVAFGPQGTADGDNPQIAARVLTDPAMGWLTQWYATPQFGGLKQGTGLLLDMGRTVTITTVSLTLGSPPGAALELRLGTAPDFSALSVVTSATATRDQLSLPLTAPVRARYVLVWFTRLPPDDAGTYQGFVHQITVQGQP